MTDYNQIERMWGGVQSEWKAVRLQDKYLSTVLTVAAWTGMIAFFAFGIVFWATGSHTATYWMLGSLILWVTTGIMVIRIRRAERKLITFDT
jgi:hypothetical protein